MNMFNGSLDPAAYGIKHVEEVTSADMGKLASVHELCQRLNIALLCPMCGEPFQGANNGHERTLSITCRCREIKSVNIIRV